MIEKVYLILKDFFFLINFPKIATSSCHALVHIGISAGDKTRSRFSFFNRHRGQNKHRINYK